MKKTAPFIILVFILAFHSLPLFAQLPQPGGDPDAADVPIDGGLSMLLAAGVGYAVKKGYEKRKRSNGKLLK